MGRRLSTGTFAVVLYAASLLQTAPLSADHPVRDLTADSFEVLERGTARPIAAFAFVDAPVLPSMGPAQGWAPWAATRPPPLDTAPA